MMVGSDEAVYVVVAAHGQYSEHSEWVVCAYRGIEAAEDHVDHATRAARLAAYLWGCVWDSGDDLIARMVGDDGLVLRSEYDPDPQETGWWMDSQRFHDCVTSIDGPPTYSVWTVPLMAAVPQPEEAAP